MRQLATALTALLLFIGCSDDEIIVLDAGPTGAPAIRFSQPSGGGDEPLCVSLNEDVTAFVPFRVETEELLLRPPGICGDRAQCGHLALYAQGVLNNLSPVPVISLQLHKLADPYHDGSPGSGTSGSGTSGSGSQEPDVLQLRVEVLNEKGDVILDRDDVPLTDSLQLITVDDCDAR